MSRMTARLALVALMATGLTMAGGGTAFALSGNSGGDNATASQYAAPQPNQGGQLPNQGGQLPIVNPGTQGLSGRQVVVQTGVRRVAAQDNGGNLPFTGFAAIPVLLIGTGLLIVGVMTRRRLSGPARAT